MRYQFNKPYRIGNRLYAYGCDEGGDLLVKQGPRLKGLDLEYELHRIPSLTRLGVHFASVGETMPPLDEKGLGKAREEAGQILEFYKDVPEAIKAAGKEPKPDVGKALLEGFQVEITGRR